MHFNLRANVSVQLQSKEVKDELEQPLNRIQFDDKSGALLSRLWCEKGHLL